MKSKIVILALVGLTAGVFGTVGSRILARSDAPAAAGDFGRVPARSVAKEDPSSDACRGLVRKVSGSAMPDAQLKKLLKKHRDCRAVVVDSKAPGSGAASGPRIVTIPATTQAPPSMEGSESTEGDDDFGESEYEEDHDGEDGTYFEAEQEED